MPITVNWYDSHQRIARWEFLGSWTWSDYYAAMTQSNALLDSVDHPVNLLVDMLNTRMIAPSFPAHFKQMAKFHPRMNVAVLVFNNMFIDTMIGIMMRFQPGVTERLRLVHSMDEAHEVLRELGHPLDLP